MVEIYYICYILLESRSDSALEWTGSGSVGPGPRALRRLQEACETDQARGPARRLRATARAAPRRRVRSPSLPWCMPPHQRGDKASAHTTSVQAPTRPYDSTGRRRAGSTPCGYTRAGTRSMRACGYGAEHCAAALPRLARACLARLDRICNSAHLNCRMSFINKVYRCDLRKFTFLAD
jgi:hypothetical protein